MIFLSVSKLCFHNNCVLRCEPGFYMIKLRIQRPLIQNMKHENIYDARAFIFMLFLNSKFSQFLITLYLF